MNRARACALALLALLGHAYPAQADWLLTPFVGASLATETAFFDLDDVVGDPHTTVGVTLTRFPKGMLGIDVATSVTPSVFTGHDLVESSRVLMAMGSLVIAVPERWLRAVRPYALVGGGLVHVTSADIAGAFPVDSTRGAASVGAGVWLPMTSRLGARFETRFIRSGLDSSSSRFETWLVMAGATIRLR